MGFCVRTEKERSIFHTFIKYFNRLLKIRVYDKRVSKHDIVVKHKRNELTTGVSTACERERIPSSAWVARSREGNKPLQKI